MIVNWMLSKGLAGMQHWGPATWTHVLDQSDNTNRPMDFTGMDVVSLAMDNDVIARMGQRQDQIRDATHANRVFAASHDLTHAVDLWMQQVHSADKREHLPSKGIYAVGLALSLCDQVDIYGFSDELRGQPYHCARGRLEPANCALHVPCSPR